MVTITATYEGSLRCIATHGPSGTTVTTDAPKDNHGKGESFSPTDMVATALIVCSMTVMGIAAQKAGIELKGMSGKVVKGMVTDPRRIGSLPVEITIPVAVSDQQRAMLENAGRTCPVAMSIHPDIAADMTFHWTG